MNTLDPILEFREDHRKVRDGLLSLIDLLDKRDVVSARKILGNLDKIVGPHFRYEEEALYPALKVFLGEYVDDLLKEHDGVIQTAKACADILSKDTLTPDEAKKASNAARALLVHVSNCDGLAILSERLNPTDLATLGRKFEEARKENISLLEWADKVRTKH